MLTCVLRRYVETVFNQMRGLQECDGIKNDKCFNDDERDATSFLNEVAGVSCNDLRHLDLTERGLDDNVFFYVLAAAIELSSFIETVQFSRNAWDDGVHMNGALKPNGNDAGAGDDSGTFPYRNFVVAAWEEREGNPILRSIDGAEIDDDQRGGALDRDEVKLRMKLNGGRVIGENAWS